MSQEKLQEVLMSAACLLPAADIMTAVNKDLEHMPQYVVAVSSLENCTTSRDWLFKLLMQMYANMENFEGIGNCESFRIEKNCELILWVSDKGDSVHVRLGIDYEKAMEFLFTLRE